jgi:hypothetical protein
VGGGPRSILLTMKWSNRIARAFSPGYGSPWRSPLKVATECGPADRSWMVSTFGQFGRLVMLKERHVSFGRHSREAPRSRPRIRPRGVMVLECWSTAPIWNCTPRPRGWECFQGDSGVRNHPGLKLSALGYSVRPFHGQTRNPTSTRNGETASRRLSTANHQPPTA